ncbi:hypothetical protein F5887DRAFT_423054 [Amanita rubescens]|nr:hypothetical protein F5887DRAFT_423054 [Amanita rubescens]
MAPRLRSSHARQRQAILETGFPVNTRGLPALPAELLLEIVSQTAAAPIPNYITQPLPVNYLERTATLRILSQLCRSLRNALLPALWERIEACTTTFPDHHRGQPPRWQKAIAFDLVAQLETVTIREPSLASYVRIVNVLISPYSCRYGLG